MGCETEQKGVFHLPLSARFQSVRYTVGRVNVMLSQSIPRLLLAKQCGLHITNQICQTTSVFPPHVQQENLASIIIAPQGELPKFLPSSFVRNEALSFPAICWNMSFDIKSHRFPLAAWPRQMFIIFIYVSEDDPAARRCRGLAADAHVMLIMSKSLLNKLTLGDNLESIWGNCGFL